MTNDKMDKAFKAITGLGYDVQKHTGWLTFVFNNSLIRYYPSNEWASGDSIKNDRGLSNLLKQIKNS